MNGHQKRVVFVTVGTTALLARELGATCRDGGRRVKSLAKEFHEAGRRYRAGGVKEVRNYGSVYTAVVAAHREIWNQAGRLRAVGVLARKSETSAEMTSTYLIANQADTGFGGRFRPGKDRLVLLASDTADGVFSARVNAQLMHDCLFEPPCSCGADFAGEPDCTGVKVEVVEGMEAREALGAIGEKLRAACQRHVKADSRVLFNITGGYKGVIPLITWLCTDLYRGRAEIYYQHEEMESVARIHFLQSGGVTESYAPLALED